MSRYSLIVLMAGLLFCAMLSACGVKTPPYPAESTLPNKVRGLTQTLDDQGLLTLSWSAPETNMLGRPLKSLGGFEVEMSDNEAANYCEGCPVRFEKVDLVPPDAVPPGLDYAPGPYYWRHKLTAGHVYTVRVAGVSSNGGLHPQAWTETTVWVLGPAASLSFSAKLDDKAVLLTWPKSAAGLAVDVEKKGPDGEWRRIEAAAAAPGRWLDMEVEYEKSYAYRARLTRQKGESQNPGPWSPERTILVEDITPPPPPGYIDAAQTGRAVRLSWESSVVPDLAGYRLYRRIDGEGGGYKRIGPDLITAATFLDETVPPDAGRVRYQATAVDSSRRANESRPSPPADIFYDQQVEAPRRPDAAPQD